MPTVDFAARVETTLASIQESEEIHPDNKELIAEFKRDLQLEGLSDGWLQKLTAHLKVLAEHLEDHRFEDLEEDDIKDLVEWAQQREKSNGEPVSESTVNAYKQVIKRFWRWMHDTPKGEHPDMVDWINTTRSTGSDTLPKDLLTREDVAAMKEACKNPRDRAFIAMLYETGARIGELIDVTVGDIEDEKNYRKVVIDGKTGPRRLPLVESSPALNKWLNEHPSGEKSDPLWSQLEKPEVLSYHYIRKKLLPRAAERAGVEKPVNPHAWRHSRATELANEFTEAQMCEWFGWVQGSDVPARYVHLSGRDIDNAYGQLHGLSTVEEEEHQSSSIECPRCNEVNERRDRFCSRCGYGLDEDTREEVEETQEEAEEGVIEVENETEARIVSKVLADIRQNPSEYVDAED